jgi:hypothetical protein
MGDVWGTVPIRDYKSGLANFQQRALAGNHLLPLIERFGLAKAGEEERVILQIRRTMKMEPVLMGNITATDNDAVHPSQIIGFDVTYTDSSSERAERMCNGLTSLLLEEKRAQRRQSRDDTREFLQRQVEEAKKNLETIHAQLVMRRANRGARTIEEKASDQELAHDYKSAQTSLAQLDKMRKADDTPQISIELEANERVRVLLPCSHPDSADSPNRWFCASAGVGVGLLLGIGLLLML